MPNQPSGWANSHWQSSVHRWLVSNLVVMFTLSLAAIASTMDHCPNFGTEFRTIGPGDTKRLWLITGELDMTISNLTLYNVSSSALTVDHKNDTDDKLYLNNSSHTPVLIAWRRMPNWTGHVENVVLLEASDTQRRLLLSMFNTSNQTEYQVFNFNTSSIEGIKWLADHGGRWISSDENDTFYVFDDKDQRITSFNVDYKQPPINIISLNSTHHICNVTDNNGSSVIFTKDNCLTNDKMAETITNGFLNGNYFYLFGTESVFIFSATEAFKKNIESKVTTLAFSQFVQCDQTSPSSTTTTSQSPATHSTVYSITTTPTTSQSPLTTCPTLPSTEWTIETVSTDNWSHPLNTSSSSPTGFHYSRMTLILVVVLFVAIVVVVIALLAIVPCFYSSRRSTRGTRASTEKKRGKLSLGGKLKTPSLSAQPPPRVNSAFGKLDSNINLDIDIAQPSNSDMDAMSKVENGNNEQATASKPTSKPVVVSKPKPTSAQVAAKKHKHSLPKVSLHHKHSRGNDHKQKAACSPMGANNHKRKHSAHKPVSARKA